MRRFKNRRVKDSKIKNPKNDKKQSADKASVPQEGVVPAYNMHQSVVASNCNIPPPSVLRQEARIQQEVQQRLQDLSEKIQTGNTKIKLQRGDQWISL